MINLNVNADAMRGAEALFRDHALLSDVIMKKVGTPRIEEVMEMARRDECGPLSLPTIWLEKYLKALQEEVEELRRAVQWKWWRGERTDLRRVRVEIIDVFHFVISAAMASGMNGSDFARIYYEKRAVNVERQKVGKREGDDAWVGDIPRALRDGGGAAPPRPGGTR